MTTDIAIALARAAQNLMAPGRVEKGVNRWTTRPGLLTALPRGREILVGVDTAPRSAPFNLL